MQAKTRSQYEVRDKNDRVWDVRRTQESAEEMRRDMEEGSGMEGVSIKEVVDVQDRYYLKNDETGEKMTVLSFSESEAVRQAWLEWDVTKDAVSVENTESVEPTEEDD